MTGGILLNIFKLVPITFIATFYSGLGSTLFLAGVLFIVYFLSIFLKLKKILKKIINSTNVKSRCSDCTL